MRDELEGLSHYALGIERGDSDVITLSDLLQKISVLTYLEWDSGKRRDQFKIIWGKKKLTMMG
jgi:hypothetical protein